MDIYYDFIYLYRLQSLILLLMMTLELYHNLFFSNLFLLLWMPLMFLTTSISFSLSSCTCSSHSHLKSSTLFLILLLLITSTSLAFLVSGIHYQILIFSLSLTCKLSLQYVIICSSRLLMEVNPAHFILCSCCNCINHNSHH